MKLSKKILDNIFISIIITIFLSLLASNFVFKRSINEYYNSQFNEQLNQMATDISHLKTAYGSIDGFQLQDYASSKNLNIIIYDKDGNIIEKFDGLVMPENKNEKLIKSDINLKNTKGENIGKISFLYYENTLSINKSIDSFYKNTISSYAFIAIFSVAIGILLSYLFAKKISGPIDELNKNTKAIISSKADISFKKYNIYEIDELSSNLNVLNKTLSLQEQYRSDYAQDIAHELRTPLTNLLLHLEGIRDEIIDADKDTINTLVAEVKRLNKMVENLHSSFSSTNKLMKANIKSINISELLNTIIESFHPLMDEKSLKANKNIVENVIILTDEDKFTQIISNLLTNAIKASDENQQIDISLVDYNNRITIIIKDYGCGISEENQKHIFERFFRVDNARNRANGGHGLGLSIVKNFVDLLGGEIKVSSKIEKGSEFILTLKK